MKKHFRHFVASTSTSAVFWLFYRLCGSAAKVLLKTGNFLAAVHGHALRSRLPSGEHSKTVNELFPDLTVAHGPFAGMKYPGADSVGSTILPKLLGCYESELHPVVADILRKDYAQIVAIGCAEGYYAIGLGMRFPDAVIYAFDTDADARELCRAMAALNRVQDRLRLGSSCSEEVLISLKLGPKALVVSDCEGYEKALFTTAVADALAGIDILIETHDFLDIEISSLLKQRFAATHDILAVESVDDIKKARTYEYPELSGRDIATRLSIVREGRPSIMEWLYMTPKPGIPVRPPGANPAGSAGRPDEH